MEGCNIIDNMIKVEGELCVNKNDECLGMNVSLKSRKHAGFEERDQMLINTSDVCRSQFEFLSDPVCYDDHTVVKSICKDYNGSEDNVCNVPVNPNCVKDKLFFTELNTVSECFQNKIESVVCTDSDLRCDFLTSDSENAEKVFLELTESCDMRSGGNYACADEHERTLSQNSSYYNASNSIPTLETKKSNSVRQVLSLKGTNISIYNGRICSTSDIGESRVFNDRDKEEREFLKITTVKEDSKSNLIDSFGESKLGSRNNDSDTISANEKEEKDVKMKSMSFSESLFEEICISEKDVSPDQHIHNQDALPLNKENQTSPAITEAFIYKCTNCSFSDRDLENLTSHVLTCFKKRKQGKNLTNLCNGEPPRKICVTSRIQPSVAPKGKLTTLSKVKPVVLPQIEMTQNKHSVPLKPKFSAQSKIARAVEVPQVQQIGSPKPRLSFMSKVRHLSKPQVSPKPRLSIVPYKEQAVLPQSHVPKYQQSVSSKSGPSIASKVKSFVLPQPSVTPKAQVVISPQAQLVTSSKTEHTATQKYQVINTSKSRYVVSPQSQHIINSPSQLSVASNPKMIVPATQNLPLKSQITLSPEANVTEQIQPIVTFETQLPIMSTTQYSSASEPQVITTPNVQFPLASGTKLTLGPHSAVPVVPQTPLTISPQGLTIAQAGSQLLITTKVQPNAGAPNQPTLLGLGIGTNPTVAPKNIVLLPNLLFNSISPSTEKANDKQSPTAIQSQIILQTPTTALSSVAPVQLQQSLVYTSQSLTSQSQVLLSPVYTVANNSVCTSATETSTSSVVEESKSSVTPTPFKSQYNASTPSTSAINPTSDKQSGRFFSVPDKFICEICDDYVDDLDKLRGHMLGLHTINLHPKMMPSFNCKNCQFCFFTEQGLERHLLGSHGLVTSGLQEAADKGKDSGRCPICGWGYQSKLLNHVSADHKMCLKPADLSYKCTFCAAAFGMYKLFQKHISSVHRPAMSKHSPTTSQSSSSAVK